MEVNKLMIWNDPLIYGNTVNFKFSDIWGNVDEFLQDYNNIGIPVSISDASATTLYYLLYARYGESTAATPNTDQFKYKIFSLIFQYGPTWEKNLDIQKQLRELSLEELLDGGKAIYNHSLNPSTMPSTDTLEELTTVNDQNVTKYKKNKIDAYRILSDLLKTDVTGYFLDRFKTCFITVIAKVPLWYVTDLIGDDEK